MTRRLPLSIIRAVTPVAHREFVVGDTLERAAEIERSHGERAAVRWLWRETWRVIAQAPRHRLAVRAVVGHSNAAPRDGLLRALWHDVRYAARLLKRAPVFTGVAVATLALGIGANTAVFSVVNSVLLRPLAYGEPERLYSVQETIPQFAYLYPRVPVNARHYLEWKRRCTCFEDVALADGQELNLTGDGEPERLAAARVTANFFAVLGVAAETGRTFRSDEGEPGNDSVVVLSYALWRRRFGANPEIVGQTVDLNGVAHLVVGILPRTFRHHVPLPRAPTVSNIDVYKPWPIDELAIGWAGDHNYGAVARLPQGKTPEQALAELNVLQTDIATRFEDMDRALTLTAHLTPLQDQVVQRGRTGLLLLLGAIGTVLLIACLNLANFMLVRATTRARETAIRAALGASKLKILRAVMMESLLIACCGVAVGGAVAFGLVEVFLSMAPNDLPRGDEVSVDLRALVFAVALSFGAALLFGTVPALRMMQADPQDSLRTSRAVTESANKLRLREWFVASEIALSVALLVVAGLLLASYARLDVVERGYDAHNLLTAEVSLPRNSYPDRDARRRFYDRLVDRLEAQPGVASAGIASMLPLRGDAWTDIVTIEGDTRPLDQLPLMPYRTVSPDYLQTLDIPLYAGRSLENSDAPRRVAVVSRRTAEQLWPGENAVGKRFRRGVPTEPPFEVVGIAGDVRSASLEEDPPTIVYVPLWERAPETGAIAIRTTSSPLLAADALRESVRTIDPNVPVSRIETMEQIESGSLAQRRFQTQLVMVFAASALLLVALGVYGVVAYSTARRTHEIGLRMALGAQPRAVSMMVVRQGLRLVLLGVVGGIALALVIGRFLAALLFSVTPTDPVTFVTVAAIVVCTAVIASWIPARRAARTLPLEALRYE